jgi:beta-galactosidase/beta-glucuronidase
MTTPASQQDGTYPRPQLVRAHHRALDIQAGFAYDDADRGRDEHWERDSIALDRTIQLPFPPESPASEIGDTGFHSIVWYRIPLTEYDLGAAGVGTQGERILLHFGAVDYLADVWVDGQHVAQHEGGQTPFCADITAALDRSAAEHQIVVRAQDDPLDLTMPRGKQDWRHEPHAIWYHRTTGIWRTVWVEAVPPLYIETLSWIPDLVHSRVRAELEFNRRPDAAVAVRAELSFEGLPLGVVTVQTDAQSAVIEIPLANQLAGKDHQQLLWSPENPRLIDATITLTDAASPVDNPAPAPDAAPDSADTVTSYFGLRSTAAEHGHFLLNDRPYYVRSVLEQGYWPTSHLTAPSLQALREEVELIRSLGFNAARIHQKVEDPRFLFWADRLGLLLWGETAAAYEFTPTAVERLTREWLQIVRRDRSHPSIVTWVPFNESWGIPHIAHDPAQRAYALALVNLTRALDPTRPVISNDGWEHVDSDVWSIHDYEASGHVLRTRYGSRQEIDELLRGIGPAGRRISVADEDRPDRGQPVMLTEFGGVSFAVGTELDDSWGYSTARDADDFTTRITAILDAVNASSELAGFCYTQLTDTRQETNGLCDQNRVPKLPAEDIARIIRGPRSQR